MGSEANKAQRIGSVLLVDQYQVGLDVAIMEIFPFAGQCVVVVSRFQRLVICQRDQGGNQDSDQ